VRGIKPEANEVYAGTTPSEFNFGVAGINIGTMK